MLGFERITQPLIKLICVPGDGHAPGKICLAQSLTDQIMCVIVKNSISALIITLITLT